MHRWGFIYTLGPDATQRRVDHIGSPECELIAVGVNSTDEAADAAAWLVGEGAELVEMCGAFGPAAVAAAAGGIDGAAPYGAVTYPCDQASGLHTLFG